MPGNGTDSPTGPPPKEVVPATSVEPPSDPTRDENILLEWLATHNETCPVCKYNLRNLVSSRCPECGWELQIRIGTKESVIASWVATLVSLCIGAGLGIPSIIMIVMAGGDMFRDRFLCGGLCMLWFSLCMPLSFVLLLVKRKFVSMSVDVQRSFAVLAGMLTSLAIIALLANIFGGW